MTPHCVRFLLPLLPVLFCQGCLFITPNVHEWSVETREERQVRAFRVDAVHHVAASEEGLRVLVDGRYEKGSTHSYLLTIPKGKAVHIGSGTEGWQDVKLPLRVDVKRVSERRFLARYGDDLIPVMHVSAPVHSKDGQFLAARGQVAVIDDVHVRLLFREPEDNIARSVRRMDDWVHTPLEPFEYAAHGLLVGTVAVTETVVMTGLVVVGGSVLVAGGLIYAVIALPLGAL